MAIIIIDKNKIYLKKNGKRKKKVNSIFPYLSCTIELSDNVTLKNIFEIIDREKYLFDIVFSSSLGGFPVDDFIQEINEEEDSLGDEIDYISFGSYAEISKLEKKDIKDDLNSIFDLYDHLYGASLSSDISYSLSLSSLSKFKNLKIRINDFMDIFIIDEKNENENLFKANLNVKVFDFFHCILDEVSFYGNRKYKKKRIKELNNISNKVKAKT